MKKKNKRKAKLGFIAPLLAVITAGALAVFASSCVGENEPEGTAQAMAKYYVSPKGNDLAFGGKDSPFATLNGAFRAIKKNKDNFVSIPEVNIYLDGGDYFITDADILAINGQDIPSGVKITVQPQSGQKPIINGGKKVSGWQTTTLNGNTVFCAQIEKGLDGIYSMTVNGKPAQLAKTIDDVFDGRHLSPQNAHGAPFANGSFSWQYYNNKDKSKGIVATNNGDILSGIVNPSQTQAVWYIEWKQFLINIDKIDGDRITSDYWNVIAKEIDISSGAEYFWPNPTHRFFLQNDISFITKPGEFCYDKKSGKIYYYPNDGESVDSITAEIPVASKIMELKGSVSGGIIKNVTFKGLTFANTRVDYIDEYGGFAINQAQQFEVSAPTGTVSSPVYHRGMMGAAISMEYCNDVKFEDCVFQNIGLTAISMGEGVKNCAVKGNIFKDLGNCAVMMSDPSSYEVESNARITDNIIENNVIRRVGCINKSSPAILAHYVSGTRIAHNDIYDCPYSAISVGWGWAKLANSYAGKNIITQNKIGNYLTVLKDGGGVYTLGNQPNSIIEYNYFYSQRNNIAGVYLDEATSGYTVRYNAFYLNDITDDKGYLVKSDYCLDIPSMYWLNINDASGNGGTENSVMTDIKVVSNFYFMKNGYGKTTSHPSNIIPPILNDDPANVALRNIGYNSRADFLSSSNVNKIMGYAGLTDEYEKLLKEV